MFLERGVGDGQTLILKMVGKSMRETNSNECHAAAEMMLLGRGCSFNAYRFLLAALVEMTGMVRWSK